MIYKNVHIFLIFNHERDFISQVSKIIMKGNWEVLFDQLQSYILTIWLKAKLFYFYPQNAEMAFMVYDRWSNSSTKA